MSKRPERFHPQQWPTYYTKASGCRVWDLDGREYLDMSIMGVGACVLGYADPDVNRAVIAAIEQGAMTTLNCPEEVELADVLCELHPWAQMVRLARTGGEAMAIAVRIARARTGRDHVAFCGYHGWSDWYLAANLSDEQALDGHLLPGLAPAGVPRGLIGTIRPFQYNDLDGLRRIVSEARGGLAAIVMEPSRETEPQPGFLEEVRHIATAAGAVLIFDEVTSGWRMANGGIHLVHGVMPDLAVFGKALGNGFPIAAIIGREAVMQAAQETFISSTFWTERIGPVAALATLKKFRLLNVSQRLIALGTRVQDGWRDAATRHGLRVDVAGIPPLSHLMFAEPHERLLSTLFTQWMLEHQILASVQYYASYAHRDDDLGRYLEAMEEVFGRLARAMERGEAERLLQGPVRQQGFKRLTQ